MANWYVNNNGNYSTILGNSSSSTNQIVVYSLSGSYTPQLGDFVYSSNTYITPSSTTTITSIISPWNGTSATYGVATGIINTGNAIAFFIYNATVYANSAPSLLAISTIIAPGDTVYIANNHTETSLTTTTYVLPGTASAPNKIICTDTNNNIPVASDLKTGASIITSGSGSGLKISGTFYCYGVNFTALTGAAVNGITLGNGIGEQIYENCNFKINASSGAQSIFLGNGQNAGSTRIKWSNCTVSFGTNVNPSCGLVLQGSYFEWKNTLNALQYNFAYSSVFKSTPTTATSVCLLDGVDFSYLGTGKSIIAGNYNSSGLIQLLNCEMGSGAAITAANPSASACFIDLINSDSIGAGTGYRQERWQIQGSLTTETSIIEATPAAASDGVQSISWKVVTSNLSTYFSPFECFPIIQWVSATGGNLVATIDIITSVTPLNNNDIWVEAEYLGTSGTPISSVATSNTPNILTAGTQLTASSSTWNGSLATPQIQQLIVNFAVQIPGYVRFNIKVAKPSTTLWINPLVRII